MNDQTADIRDEIKMSADAPRSQGNAKYHIRACPGDLGDAILAPGAQGRVKQIMEQLTKVREFPNDKRGLYACSGKFMDLEVGVAPTGMGSASVFITLPEMVQCTKDPANAPVIRVGSCGSAIKESKVGEAIIVNCAYSWDGASLIGTSDPKLRYAGFLALSEALKDGEWLRKELCTYADLRLFRFAREVAVGSAPCTIHIGEEYTTADFYHEQGRPEYEGDVLPSFLAERHEKVMARSKGCYSMEAAAFYRMLHLRPVLAINAIYAQRHTNEFADEAQMKAGDDLAIDLALKTLLLWSTTGPRRNPATRA